MTRRHELELDVVGRWRRQIIPSVDASRECDGVRAAQVTKLTEKNYLRTLENAVRFGRWVLMENVLETLDASLEPLLLQQTFVQGGTKMIKIGDSHPVRAASSWPSHDAVDLVSFSDRDAPRWLGASR